MSVNQEQFDADLQDLVQKVGALITAVNNLPPTTDFTAEDSEVKQAAADVQAELDKLNPPPGG